MSFIIAFPAARRQILHGVRDVLAMSGFGDITCVTSASEALQEMNRRSSGILICCVQLPDLYYREILFCMPSTFHLLLLDSEHVISGLREEDVMALALPVRAHELTSTLRMMEQSLMRELRGILPEDQRQRRQASGKKRSLSARDRKDIDDAKALLIERNHMTEEEAYRYLQKTSMDTGRTMTETAQMVLLFS